MKRSKWDLRIQRADELTPAHPFAAEALRFYKGIATFQKELYAHVEAVRRPAMLLLSLLIAQLCLGFAAFLTRVAWGKDAAQPELPMVVSTVAHVAVGALLLATAVVLAIQVWRHVPVAFEERVPQAHQDPSAA